MHRTMPSGTALLTGFAWGFGAIMFGQSVSAIGIALANTFVLAISSALGSLLPMLFLTPGKLHERAGITILLGIAVEIVGIALCGRAGMLRERASRADEAAQRGDLVGTARPLGIALLLVLGAGLLSAVFNIGFALAHPIIDYGQQRGLSLFASTNLIWVLMLGGGALSNLGFCAYLLIKNRSAAKFHQAGSLRLYLLGLLMAASMGWQHLCLRRCCSQSGVARGFHRLAPKPCDRPAGRQCRRPHPGRVAGCAAGLPRLDVHRDCRTSRRHCGAESGKLIRMGEDILKRQQSSGKPNQGWTADPRAQRPQNKINAAAASVSAFIPLDKNSFEPLYYQIQSQLEQQIRSGQLAVDDPLPGEAELSRIFGISRMTSRQALQGLTTDGFAYRERGRGTFVRASKVEKHIAHLLGFSAEMRLLGLRASTKVLAKSVVTASAQIATSLQLQAASEVTMLHRLSLGR